MSGDNNNTAHNSGTASATVPAETPQGVDAADDCVITAAPPPSSNTLSPLCLASADVQQCAGLATSKGEGAPPCPGKVVATSGTTGVGAPVKIVFFQSDMDLESEDTREVTHLLKECSSPL